MRLLQLRNPASLPQELRANFHPVTGGTNPRPAGMSRDAQCLPHRGELALPANDRTIGLVSQTNFLVGIEQPLKGRYVYVGAGVD